MEVNTTMYQKKYLRRKLNVAAIGLISGCSILLPCISASAQNSESQCGTLQSSFGPFDYRTERGNNLYLVESAHFTPPVEALIKGNTGHFGGDIHYTLKVFPNHHRALLSIVRYAEVTKSAQPPSLGFTIDCYFDRAIRFQPNDLVVRMIHSKHLMKTGRADEARRELEYAGKNSDENPVTYHNIGLLYFDMKDYAASMSYAKKAYDLGFGRSDLRDRLRSVKKWVESDKPDAVVDGTTSAPTTDSIISK